MSSSLARTRERVLQRTLLMGVVLAMVACGGGGDDSADAAPPVETLVPDPAGAPVDTADGRLTCLGQNKPEPPASAVIELTGYVRTLADPGADAEPPAAAVEAFTSSGTSLGQSFADPTKDGRLAVTVAIPEQGFTGYVVATETGFLDYRFQTSRPVTTPDVDGWAWLVTSAEADAWATTMGTTIDSSRGILIGGVHDCDNFGVQYAMIQVDGSTDGIAYTENFALDTARTFTSSSGRFVMPNVAPGTVVVKAFGRLASGGPLTLLSSITTTVVAGSVTSVGLQPRVANE